MTYTKVDQTATAFALVETDYELSAKDLKDLIAAQSEKLRVTVKTLHKAGKITTFGLAVSYRAKGANRTDIAQRLEKVFHKDELPYVSRCSVVKHL